MIKIKNLTKKYNNFIAVDNITFSLKKGEITGFLGPNGAGKTTVLRILTGYLESNSGSITYEDQEYSIVPDSLKSKIGYLPEENPLYKDMRTDDFLIFVSKLKNFPKEELKQIIIDCGLGNVLNKKIETLSKGYKQRVGLAKALIGNPEYLFLDEPTTGLDPNQKEEIIKLIKKFSKDKIILFSSHVLSEVSEIADRVIIINEGKISADGSKDTLSESHFKTKVLLFTADQGITKVKSTLKLISGIESLSLVEKLTQGFSRYSIEYSGSENIADIIFENALKNKWKLRELTIQSHGLEDLFKDLTK